MKTADRKGTMPLLPLVLVLLHLGYGAGFLVGLFRFAGRWGDRQGKTPAFVRSDT
jgi:hypothetical protein